MKTKRHVLIMTPAGKYAPVVLSKPANPDTTQRFGDAEPSAEPTPAPITPANAETLATLPPAAKKPAKKRGQRKA